MGSCRYYLGEVNIPKEKRQTYAGQALKLLRAGGMMSVKRVNLYGQKITATVSPGMERGRLCCRQLQLL